MCCVLYCVVFIHFYSASDSMSLSEALLTTAIDTVLEFTRETLQATVSEGLAQGPYLAARAGFVPMTLRSKGIDSTNASPRLTCVCVYIEIYTVPSIR